MLRRTSAVRAKLLVVESPNKLAALGRYTRAIPDLTFGRKDLAVLSSGPDETVVVAPTVGHLCTLSEVAVTPSERCTQCTPRTADDDALGGMDFTFDLTWRVSKDRKSTLADLVDRVRALKSEEGITEVILATDPDREGELIAAHALRELQAAFGGKLPCAYSRAYIHSITEDGVVAALGARKPNFIDKPLAQAAETRHMLDKLIGFVGSNMVRAFSHSEVRTFGRVQTPALLLAHARTAKHDAFLARRKSSFGFTPTVAIGGRAVKATLSVVPASGEPVKRRKKGGDTEDGGWSPDSLEAARVFVSALGPLDKLEWSMAGAPDTATRAVRSPEPLTLQGLMLLTAKHLQLSAEQTMEVCQGLFHDGLITYPRTDSARVEDAPAAAIREYIEATFGEDYVASSSAARPSKKKASNVEDAHEAIRPTEIARETKPGLSESARAVYDLIRRTTLAAFMTPVQTETAGVTFTTPVVPGHGETAWPAAALRLRATTARTVHRGWNAAWADSAVAGGDAAEGQGQGALDVVLNSGSGAVRLKALAPVERKTPPPPLFTDATLIEELKRHDIGRPSTYASIMRILRQRQYVDVTAAGVLRPTETGDHLALVAQRYMARFADLAFTGRMERALDRIAQGESSRDAVGSASLARLVATTTEATRATYAKAEEDPVKAKALAQALDRFVPPLAALGSPGCSATIDEYCNVIGRYINKNKNKAAPRPTPTTAAKGSKKKAPKRKAGAKKQETA